jgi:7-cyano-7-deazaguanine synthase
MKTGILLSGGIDSIALTYWKKPQLALTIDYGHAPAQAEIRAASAICQALSIPHYIVQVDCSELGSGDLARKAALAIAPVSEWWPYRNQLLVTLAAMKGIALDVGELLVGSVKTDSVHRDGTVEFYNRLSDLLSIQEGNMKISAPALDMTSSELVRVSEIPTHLLSWAHSCHTNNFACGFCRGCRKHFFTLGELGYVSY